ncbi:DUF4037 domain-containing protein [Collinsella ihumii]|uniref:DUF4037 domain-containing protein n=1 Tax=Collinsella ihumii TaxID=1720204 RepID=UPI000831F8F6|nr:DUF4037 domain-containing protein [Collinsella ihumii]
MSASGPGLALAERFWQRNRAELFEGELAGLGRRVAAGLVGEGSECWGYDDAISRDHDWGPGCCIWLMRSDWERFGGELQRRYNMVASRYMEGIAPRPATPPGTPPRVGVFDIEIFYQRFLPSGMPHDSTGWLQAREAMLAAATNGRVFYDGSGRFSAIRKQLLAYYPDDVRLHRIASNLARAAQAGQYNFPRQAARGDSLAALSALVRFNEAVCGVLYALARRYRPFYKWVARELLDLGQVGARAHAHLEDLAALVRGGDAAASVARIEEVAKMLVDALDAAHLSSNVSPWLMDQATEVARHIESPSLRALDLID